MQQEWKVKVLFKILTGKHIRMDIKEIGINTSKRVQAGRIIHNEELESLYRSPK